MQQACRHAFAGLIVLGLALSQSACGYLVIHGSRMIYLDYQQQTRDVNAALARYRVHVLQGKPDEAAGMFGADAEWTQDAQPPLVGRTAILGRFNATAPQKVVDYDITATDTRLIRDGALQSGTYRQKLLTPQGAFVTAQGRFEARWSHEPGNPWQIAKMRMTASAPPDASAADASAAASGAAASGG